MHTDHPSPAPAALAFDDGPDPLWTPLGSDALANAGRGPFDLIGRETRTCPLQGDEVHELLLGHTQIHNIKTTHEPDYRLDPFEDPA